jgi:type I restriction enzyme S subunit
MDAINVSTRDIASKPSGWRTIPLSDFAQFRNGINFVKDQKGKIGIPTVDVLNMYGRSITVDLGNLYRVSKKIGSEQLLQRNDLLFVRSSLKREGIGWTSLFAGANEPISFCGFIIRARLIDDTIIDPTFLTYFCRSDGARAQLIAGSGKVAITNISQDVLARLLVPIPPLLEQRQIVGVLELVQKAIEQQERLLTLTTELKKALLFQLFTKGLRREPTKHTELGRLPHSWEMAKLGDLFDTQLGKMLSQKARGGDDPKPYLRNKNVQ